MSYVWSCAVKLSITSYLPECQRQNIMLFGRLGWALLLPLLLQLPKAATWFAAHLGRGAAQ